MIYLISFLLLVSLLFNILFAYYMIKFAKMVLGIQDELENSLNSLNERYNSISKILEIPLFYDSLEIRKVHEDIKLSKDTIEQIIESFSRISEEEEDENDNDR